MSSKPRWRIVRHAQKGDTPEWSYVVTPRKHGLNGTHTALMYAHMGCDFWNVRGKGIKAHIEPHRTYVANMLLEVLRDAHA